MKRAREYIDLTMDPDQSEEEVVHSEPEAEEEEQFGHDYDLAVPEPEQDPEQSEPEEEEAYPLTDEDDDTVPGGRGYIGPIQVQIGDNVVTFWRGLWGTVFPTEALWWTHICQHCPDIPNYPAIQ